ncbi:MAG: RDD family protein [Pseudomonadota bacterium]
MNEQDPYTPPSAEIREHVNSEEGELASRPLRLLGAIIDALLLMAVMLAVLVPFGYFDDLDSADSASSLSLIGLVVSIAAFLILNGYLLAARGQTIGKVLLSMRIVSVDDRQLLPFGKLIGLRYAVFWLLSYLPVIGYVVSLVNALAIFRENRRCLHDELAGTIVIRVPKKA